MIINTSDSPLTSGAIEFVSYTGAFPNLCCGILTLICEGQREYVFSNTYTEGHKANHLPRFWYTGGDCDQYDCSEGEWKIRVSELPVELRKYALEIDYIFNENVAHGCCGGCQ